jgi:protein phosphatase
MPAKEILSGAQAAKAVLWAYKPLLSLDRTQYDEIGRSIPIPTFGEEIIEALCDAARKLFERSDLVVTVSAPFYIIGDIHGNLFDLLRILILAGQPPRVRLLFLGDYVDRGEYSVEVVTLLFSFLVRFPDSVVLLRGNHEFESTNRTYGFHAEVTSQYSSESVYNTINDAFNWMPLIATINNQVICVHGGISPHLTALTQVKKTKRPLTTYEVEYVSDLVWSDPCVEAKTYDESSRGLGVQFGLKALQDFLNALSMKTLVRAHQCITAGISRFGTDQLFTVFSCSRYEGNDNRCGLLYIDHHLNFDFFSLPPIEQIPRDGVLLTAHGADPLVKEVQAAESVVLNVKLHDMKATSKLSPVKPPRLSPGGSPGGSERASSAASPKRVSALPPLSGSP